MYRMKRMMGHMKSIPCSENSDVSECLFTAVVGHNGLKNPWAIESLLWRGSFWWTSPSQMLHRYCLGRQSLHRTMAPVVKQCWQMHSWTCSAAKIFLTMASLAMCHLSWLRDCRFCQVVAKDTSSGWTHSSLRMCPNSSMSETWLKEKQETVIYSVHVQYVAAARILLK